MLTCLRFSYMFSDVIMCFDLKHLPDEPFEMHMFDTQKLSTSVDSCFTRTYQMGWRTNFLITCFPTLLLASKMKTLQVCLWYIFSLMVIATRGNFSNEPKDMNNLFIYVDPEWGQFGKLPLMSFIQLLAYMKRVLRFG